MKDTTSEFNNFLDWAREVNAQKHDILELMLKSDNALDRVIAKDILKAAGSSDQSLKESGLI